MKSLNVVTPLLILALASHAAFADTEFGDSVPREVVRQFIGDQFGGEGKLYSDVLAAFPPFSVPDDFAVLASADQGYMARVILKTDLDETVARDAIVEVLVAQGWQELPMYGTAQQTGFVSAAPPTRPLILCNDEHGNMNLNISTGAAPRYVSLNHTTVGSTRNGFQQSCAEQIDMMTQGPGVMRMGPQLSQYAPRLLMPEPASDTPVRGFFGGGGGGSSNDWEARNTLTSDWSIDAVHGHFADQVAAQEWIADSSVTGAAVATSSWTKTVDDIDLIGVLTIVAMGEDTWDLKFRIIRNGGAQGNLGVSGSAIIRGTAQ